MVTASSISGYTELCGNTTPPFTTVTGMLIKQCARMAPKWQFEALKATRG